MEMTDGIERVLEWLDAHDDFVIASHADPDGDSLGSSLALALALEHLGKRTAVVIGQPLPSRYEWLPCADRVLSVQEAPREARSAILVECSDFERSGVGGLDTLPSLNIDHHTKNRMFADVNWIDADVAATGMMIERVRSRLDAPLTPEVAALLYVTVMTDTGSFQHSNTDADALSFAARMTAAGALPAPIAEAVYGNVPLGRVRLFGDALTSLDMHAEGRVAAMAIDSATFDRHGTRDTEGLINMAQAIAGVSVSLLFKQAGPEDFRVSLRSDGSVDVAEIASGHGGGGHPRAAGCQLLGDQGAVMRRLLNQVERALEEGR
jgi:phosphoesterase RecJ-like protein